MICQVSVVFAQSGKYQAINQLKDQAENFVLQQIAEQDRAYFKVQIRPLDKRLKLARCDSAIEFSLTGKKKQLRRNGTIKAVCPESPTWQIFIPYQATQLTQVLVTLRDIAPGEQLTAQDVKVELQDRFQTRNASFIKASQVEGTRAKKSIRRGEILNSGALCTVCKGQPVAIHAKGAGLMLKTDGIALEDGIPGQIIRIENLRSGRRIKARVVSSATVQVNI